MILKTYILHPQINQGNNTSTGSRMIFNYKSITKLASSVPALAKVFVFISNSLLNFKSYARTKPML